MNGYNDIQGIDDTMPDWNNDQPDWVKEAESLCNSGATDIPESSDSKEILGRCPHCGEDIIYGQYGAYCKNKCGMNIGKVYNRFLTKEEVKQLLEENKVFLKNMVSQKGKEYSAYFIQDGIEEFSYTNKDGQLVSGQYRFKFKLEFPKKDKEKGGDTRK